ncbi:MAG TPA: aldehyde dehydrogenase family protein [Candidatus Limnocylindrales bacterium]
MDREHLYIGGQWVSPHGTGTVPVENPATEQVIAHVPAADAADVDHAVAAAREAFGGWAALGPQERASHLDRLHRALAARADRIAATITADLGAPAKIATRVHTQVPLAVLKSYAELAAKGFQDETVGNSLVLREPVGVVGAITPWNYPLHQVVAKVGAALAAGCTVVLKPAELTPLAVYLLFDAVDEAGLPPGVLNLVTGLGPEAGEALARHQDVDMVSFTGSTTTGAHISRLAADRIARVALELGGKSANVILDDADLTKAVKVGVANALLNSGQTCTAWTRMLVPKTLYPQAISLAAESAGGYRMGDPADESTRLGPLVSRGQRQRVRGYIDRGIADGAKLSSDTPDLPERGYFVAPAILSEVNPDSVVAQEEIFGPVLVVIPYEDDDDAVRIANNSRYGLAGAVWSGDESRALSVARRLRTGAVDINGGMFNPVAPFGGYKQSGIGRELGAHGVAEFLETKAIQR